MNRLVFVFVSITILGLTACEVNDGYEKTDIGVDYKFIDKADGKKPGPDDLFLVQMQSVLGDSVLIETVTEDGLSLSPTKGPKIFTSVLALCSEGDSVHIRMSLNDYSINTRTLITADMDTAESVIMKMRITKVINEEEYVAKLRERARKVESAQLETDRDIIESYISDNNLKAQQTEDGLYYVIEKAGRGKKPENGEFVHVAYTVRLLDGTFIDSSDAELSKANNTYANGRQYGPYKFMLGRGTVIKGWDLGIGLINKGTKAKLIVPSGLAYGPNPRPGGGIPPNAVLIFDVELVEIGE